MKKSAIFIVAAGAFITLVTSSCRRELDPLLQENFELDQNAKIQVYNALPGSARTFLYMDGAPLNGATIAYGAAFPSAGYSSVPTGLHAFLLKDTLGTSTQIPLNFPMALQAKTTYSVFLYDTISAPKQIAVPTDIQEPYDSTARVRFANFVYSKIGVPNVDLYSVKRKANVFTNIPITGVTDFVPYASRLSDTLIVRSTGTTNAITQLNGFNPTEKRSYTLVLRGSYFSSTNARTLSSYINR